MKIIVSNKNIYNKYFIKKEFEVGLLLQGWEIKSIRAGNITINNSYVIIKNDEAFLFGANFTPLINSSHYKNDSKRSRKLLLKKNEINYLNNQINREGYTIILILLYWKNAWCKAKIGLAKGKKIYDKRIVMKENEWKIKKARLIKQKNK